MTVLYTKEILVAARNALKALAWANLVRELDLAYYPDPKAFTTELPAIFLKVGHVDLSMPHHAWEGETDTRVRCVIVDKWDPQSDDIVTLRVSRMEDVADVFVQTSGANVSTVGGQTVHASYRVVHAFPSRLEPEPLEDDLVSLQKDRHLFACAVDVMVRGRATR